MFAAVASEAEEVGNSPSLACLLQQAAVGSVCMTPKLLCPHATQSSAHHTPKTAAMQHVLLLVQPT